MPGRHFVPFFPGDRIHKAGLDILDVEDATGNTDSFTYAVEMHCCGARDELSHRNILRRTYRASSTCRRCQPGSFARAADAPFTQQPDWPVPASILADPDRRFDSAKWC